MPYQLLGLLHATAYRTVHAMRRQDGQGTVEYVALILLLAFVFAAVVKYGVGGDKLRIGETVVQKLKDSIDGVGDAKRVGR